MVNFNEIASKWRQRWEKSQIFKVTEDYTKKKYTIIEMYPYPSSHGLHMGHARNYVIGDCYSRFKRMQGFNVLYPMGYDSFGLPAENAAIEAKSHPKLFTEKAIKNFIKQQKELGLSYDWSRMIASHTLEYYKWDQWIFLKLYEKKLAYKKKSAVNWCPKCDTVLANEQVHNGKCWRHENQNVEIKELNQWFFKITDYAEELLRDIDKLQWNEDVKTMQRNWIGKSEGTLVYFPIRDSNEKIPIFTTRVDTLYGVTFMVYAPEHPKVLEFVKGTKYEDRVKKFINKVIVEDRFTRTAEDKEKEGMFIGKYAINPLTNEEIPIYIANFVLLEYGTGAIMAVPAHDQRDFEFAKKYKIHVKVVINQSEYELKAEKMSRAYLGNGNLVNSNQFNSMNNRDAIPEINKYLEEKRIGKRTIQYKLRDWLISRQRFWGCPIPIIYCDKCGIVPVPEKDLPVKLPDNIKFSGKGNPLATNKNFVNTKCPKCKGNAKRETDTMDTFVDSSWYFLRYCDPKNKKEIFDKKKVNYWMPINQYIGGKEHACGHLIYFRFFTKFLRDLGLLNFDEPALKLFNQGMLHKNGVVMSKSKGNVVIPEEVSKKYGIDTARLFLLFISGPEKDMEWNNEGVEGSFRFLNKLYALLDHKQESNIKDKNIISKINKTIKETTNHIENFQYNLALIEIMDIVNYLYKHKKYISSKVFKDLLTKLLLIISPFTPHIAEEMWEKLGNKGFISLQKWPSYDEKKIDKKLETSELLIQKTIHDISNVLELIKLKVPKKITLIISPKWKYSFFEIFKKELEKTRDFKALIKSCLSNKELEQYREDISKLIPVLLKDSSKIPQTLLNQETEFGTFNDIKDSLEKEFKTEIEVTKAEQSKEQKAKQAMPGKPSIIIV